MRFTPGLQQDHQITDGHLVPNVLSSL